MPSAEKVPGTLGTITFGMKISRAIATACSGPAPPNAIITASRGSTPLLIDTARIAPGDRAAAGADLDDIDDRKLHRLPRRLAADHVALLDRRRAVGDQARLGGGAAHVEADGALEPEHVGEPPCADHAGDR